MTFGEFHHTVYVLCCIFDGSVSGGPRTSARNSGVGGHPNSRHLLTRGGKADDVVLDDMIEENRHAFCEAARKCGLVAVDEQDHIHLQEG